MILDDIRGALETYCVLPSEEAYDAVVLWIAATHAAKAWETATRLVIHAPEPQCGKSRLLDIIGATCYRPEMAGNASVAAIVDAVAQSEHVTILLDEYDQWLPKGGPLVGLLNMGHQRGRAYTRMEQGKRVQRPAYAWAALAGIGVAPRTIMDRAVIISMRRRLPEESVKPYRRRRDENPLRELGGELSAWVRDGLEYFGQAEPQNPLEDRPADNWEPLLAVADYATDPGREHSPSSWAYRGRKAAAVLTLEADELREASMGVRLLSDIRDVYRNPSRNRLASTDLVALLAKRDEEAWGELTPGTLARMLGTYGVRPKMMRIKGASGAADANVRGYERAMFADAFQRYLPKEDKPGTALAVA